MSKLCQCRTSYIKSIKDALISNNCYSNASISKTLDVLLTKDCTCQEKKEEDSELPYNVENSYHESQVMESLVPRCRKCNMYCEYCFTKTKPKPECYEDEVVTKCDNLKEQSHCEHELVHEYFLLTANTQSDMRSLWLCYKCGLVTCKNPNE